VQSRGEAFVLDAVQIRIGVSPFPRYRIPWKKSAKMRQHMSAWSVVGALQNSPHLLVKDYLEERRDGRYSVVSHDRFVERVLALGVLSTLKECSAPRPL
jgi:hypothetical protein